MSTRSTKRAKKLAKTTSTPNVQSQTPSQLQTNASANAPANATENAPAPPISTPKIVAQSSSKPATSVGSPSKVLANETSDSEIPAPSWWKWAAAFVLLIAAFLRLWNLDLVPMHHDEGVNAVFVNTLFNQGAYTYNPQNFHGPTLYYFALFSAYLNTFFFGQPGFNDFSMRIVPAFFGIGIVALTLGLRRNLGALATICAAALLAISPGMVYNSRYFIHETQFVFFTLLAVVAFLRLRPRGAWWWPSLLSLFLAGIFSVKPVLKSLTDAGVATTTVTMFQFFILTWGIGGAITQSRPRGAWNWALVAAASLAMVFGSKETTPLSIVVLLLSGALTWLLCDKLSVRKFGTSSTRYASSSRQTSQTSRPRNAENASEIVDGSDGKLIDGRIVRLAFATIFVFWVVIALFFSSFDRSHFTQGIQDFFAAYDVWRKTGENDQSKPRLTYLVWMLIIETPIMVLGLTGIAVALWQRRNRFTVFCAFWAGGLFLAYSLISYKTPWLMLSFVLPLAIMAGVALQSFGEFVTRTSAAELSKSSTRNTRKLLLVTAIPAILAILISAKQMNALNFVDYDDDGVMVNADGTNRQIFGIEAKKYPYVYVHTQRQYLDMLRKIKHYAEVSGLGKKMPISINAPEHWPTPWYLRDYAAAYPGQATAPNNEGVIVGLIDQDNDLKRMLGANYTREGVYPMRPGVLLTLWVRNDLMNK